MGQRYFRSGWNHKLRIEELKYEVGFKVLEDAGEDSIYGGWTCSEWETNS